MTPDRALLLGLSQPWLLARSAASLLAALTLLAALVTSIREAPRHRAELLRAAISASSAMAALSLALAALSASRLVSAVPGAMCAAGVLSASPWGERSFDAALLSLFVTAGAQGVAAVDARLRHARITPALAAAAALAMAAAATDLAASLAFARSLNLDDVVACCASAPASTLRAGKPCLACAAARWPVGHVAAVASAVTVAAAARVAAVVALRGARESEVRAASRDELRGALRWGVVALATSCVAWRAALAR